MKKTIIAAALCLGLATAASASYTLGTTNYTTTTGMFEGASSANVASFTFTLSDELFAGSASVSNALTTANDGSSTFTTQVGLTGMKLVSRYSSNSQEVSVIKITDSSGALVATSTAITLNSNGRNYDVFATDKYWSRESYTITFSALESVLTVGETYTVMAYDSEGSALTLGLYGSKNGTGVGSGMNAAVMTGAASYQPGGMIISTTALVATADTPAIPEPATATLSLLALAGLATRRRRK